MVIPVSEMLLASFFVLFAVGKTNSKALKRFGYVVSTLLLISATLLATKGTFMLVKKNCPTICRIMKMDKCPMMKDAKCDKMKGGMEQKMPEMKKGCGK